MCGHSQNQAPLLFVDCDYCFFSMRLVIGAVSHGFSSAEFTRLGPACTIGDPRLIIGPATFLFFINFSFYVICSKCFIYIMLVVLVK
jgi:hypothetical protein